MNSRICLRLLTKLDWNVVEMKFYNFTYQSYSFSLKIESFSTECSTNSVLILATVSTLVSKMRWIMSLCSTINNQISWLDESCQSRIKQHNLTIIYFLGQDNKPFKMRWTRHVLPIFSEPSSTTFESTFIYFHITSLGTKRI
jgi:hypothetical protein